MRTVQFPGRRLELLVCCLLLCFLLYDRADASPWDVRINEIHYHPLGGSESADLEFIELYNAGSVPVDLSGWFFSAGIEYTFPEGTVLSGREYLVLSPDPPRAAERYGLARVEGPYRGRLDNGGEIVSLADSSGERVSEVHYRDGDPWPGTPDGVGPSLEFTEADRREDLHIRWKRSLFVDGTPGARNSRAEELPVSFSSRRELLSEGGSWRMFRGVEAPSAPTLEWTDEAFDDAGWEESTGGFGYGAGHGFPISTRLPEMRNQFTTLYIRHRFALDEETAAALADGGISFELLVSFDDGYIAYLNGVEVARNNVGTPGVPAPYDAVADGSRSGTDRVAIDASLMRPDGNVLAVQGLNRAPNSSDFFIGASLVVDLSTGTTPEPTEDDPLTRGVLNEVGPERDDDSPGFIELYNPEDARLDLGGFLIRTDAGETHAIPAGTVLDPGAFLLLDAAALDFRIPRADRTYLLLGEDGKTLIDALEVDYAGVAGSYGRYPDGDDDTAAFVSPSAGLPNTLDATSPVVISEVYFHPPFVPAAGACRERCSDELQYIELWNSTDQAVDLTDWRLSGAVSFTFPRGTVLPADEGLVVAANLDEFHREHPEVTNVMGDWSGRLQHDSESINLRDDLGNRRDHVRYGDGDPWNDEQPADGRDDRTFVAGWPTGADGEGGSLELLHPRLENRLGASWRASTTAGGTPGRVNSTFAAEAAPVVDSVKHRPAVPRSDQAVTISCRPYGIAPVARVTVEWAVDGSQDAPSLLEMNDDGGADDRVSGDGIYTVRIPPREDGALIRWRLLVEDVEGRSSVFPASPPVAPYRGFEGPFYLYEVDDTTPPANGAAAYRILMTANDVEELGDRGVESDVLLPATFIADTEVHYLVGVRYRGETSRREPNRSYRVDFPSDDLFDGVEHLNLNGGNGGGRLGSSTVAEILATDLYRRAGVPSPQTWAVNLRFPGEVDPHFDPRYVRKENVDDAFLARSFGDGSDDGNLYRARNPDGPGRPSGDLSYLGDDPEDYRALYEKKTNREEDDFSDVIALARAFDPVVTPPEVFAETIETLIDADQWARFFAVMALLTNSDGGIWNNNGEDYFLYRVNDGAPRQDAGKWLLLPWDLEETFVAAGERLFRPDVDAIQRFLSEPRFARLYYRHLDAVRGGPFSRGEMIKRFDFVARMYPEQDIYNVVDPLDAFVAARLGFLDRTVAATVTAGPGVPVRQTVAVVDFGETWSFVRGRTDPPGQPMAWTMSEYDAGGWESGRMGIGYGDRDDATELADMEDRYTTVFVRHPFTLDDPGEVDRWILTIDYDDAFIAYVNGVEVARSANAPGRPGDPVAFDQTAERTHEAGTPERFAFSPDGLGLTAGENVLALVGFNQALDSSDFSLNVRLAYEPRGEEVVAESGGCDGPIFAFGGRIVLGGVASPEAQSVTVDGQLADVSWITSGGDSYGLEWSAIVSVPEGESVIRVASHADLDGLDPALHSVDLVVIRMDRPPEVVAGPLAGDTVWSADAAPYRMTDDVTVPAGATLTLEPGTVVLAENGASIVVEGRIVADGTADAPIVMNAFSCDELWEGIRIRGTGTDEAAPLHVLRNVRFRHGENGNGALGFVAAESAKLLVEDCVFEAVFANVIDASGARLTVRDSRFEHVEEAIHCAGSATRIENCVFRDLLGDSDGVDFDTTSERSSIVGCLFDGCTDDGVDLGRADVEIRGNVFRGVEDKAISIEGNGPTGPSSLTENVIFDCGTGMALKNGLRVEEGHHNTITRCRVGIDLFAKDDAPDGGHGVFHSMIVWEDDLDVRLDGRSTVAFSFSDIDGGTPWPGEGNLAADPRFEDPGGGDFALRAGSPCRGTGRDASDMGAVGSAEPAFTFLRGDADGSGQLNVSDPIRILRYLFEGGVETACLDPLDVNDDGRVNISDPLVLLSFLFSGDGVLPQPYPAAGVDPTPDELPCGTGGDAPRM